jgi:methyl-accepting chemotaxis protein
MANVTAIKKHESGGVATVQNGKGGSLVLTLFGGRLGLKLQIFFMLVGLTPFIIAGLILNKSIGALYEQAFNQLDSVREIKRSQMENYFSQVKKDSESLAEFAAGSRQGEARPKHSGAANKQVENSVDKKLGDFLARFKEQNGYGDILLIAPDGQVFFSAASGNENHANVINGNLADSALGRLVKSTIDSKKYGVSDFESYLPINNAPAAFSVAPVVVNGNLEMMVALRLVVDSINQIMQFRGGIGTTGEAYLVGPDKLMRSDSFIENVNHTMNASFANPSKGSVDTPASKEALAGMTGYKRTKDYNGRSVISSYTPLLVGPLKWALIVEMEEGDEALAATYELKKDFLIIGLIGVVAIFFVAFLISRSITNPITSTVRVIQEIAGGDFTKKVDVRSRDEVGVLGETVNEMVSELRAMMGDIKTNSKALGMSAEVLFYASDQLATASTDMSAQTTSVASATEQMSLNISSMATGVEEASLNAATVSSTSKHMSSNMQGIADSIEGISLNIAEVARNTDDTLKVANKAMEMSKAAMDTMGGLGKAANEIGKVTEMIKRIAEQTNLLALNATIEAASAGDAGKGFAVVANEIKELANQSARAAEDIAAKIEGVQGNTNNAVNVITEVSNIISQINTSVADITKAVNHQTVAVTEISKHVSDATDGANNIASSIDEVAKGAHDMSRNAGEAAKGANNVSSSIQSIRKAVEDNDSNSQDISAAAKEFSKIAATLDAMMAKFKVEESAEPTA